MKNFSWQCPYCNHHATITESNYQENIFSSDMKYKDAPLYFKTIIITCPNQNCKEYIIKSSLYNAINYRAVGWRCGMRLNSWQIKPQSSAKPLPDYIPTAILNDYQEACLIKNLSPKSSATLSRRCLQGMIRDFFEIKKKNLYEEINAIQDKIDPSTYDAIDAIRKVGNIGAHMEKDINLIIDIDPIEANTLIELIETLIEEWYINRHKREQRNNKIIEISRQKQAEKNIDKNLLQENMA